MKIQNFHEFVKIVEKTIFLRKKLFFQKIKNYFILKNFLKIFFSLTGKKIFYKNYFQF